MSIADNLHRVQERIARAAESARRRADEILLVGVTKYVDANRAGELVAAGCLHLGESRPQQLWNKAEAFSSSNSVLPLHWHLIGHLQRNKVARTLPFVTLIHSVDSERLLAAIDSAANELSFQESGRISVLIEVNFSNESAKTGLDPAKVESLLATAPNYPRIKIRGLMTMAALEGGHEVAAHNFASLRNFRDRLKTNVPDCVELDELSMGMSDDFEIAIKEGATIVRVGSLLWE